MTVTADDLEAAVAWMAARLGPATGREWSVPAGTLEWDCWHTAEHVGDTLLSYAAQLIAQPGARYVRFMASADTDASPAEVLEFAQVGGGLLVSTVRTVPAGAQAYHPTGVTDAAGFAALGCIESLLHGQDIARGLDLDLDPPREICAAVLASRFPQAAAELGDIDPWAALQWATGRTELPGHPRRSRW
jgi:hypothetical protein